MRGPCKDYTRIATYSNWSYLACHAVKPQLTDCAETHALSGCLQDQLVVLTGIPVTPNGDASSGT